MKLLRKGMKDIAVGKWQSFLRGFKLYYGIIDDDFGNMTEEATIKFQTKYNLGADGIVGRKSYSKAISLGFGDIEDNDTNIHSENYPPKPTDIKPLRGFEKEKLFGKIEYIASPTPKNKEAIKITNNFRKDNIIMVKNPYLAKTCGGKYTRMLFHKDCEYQLLEMWKEWDEKGLLDRIISYGGSYVARFIRGSRKHLSNHAYGTAFDINMQWNRLGRKGALVGEKGCVRELVEIAVKHGFYFGGWFSRRDSMHFEVYKIIKKP